MENVRQARKSRVKERDSDGQGYDESTSRKAWMKREYTNHKGSRRQARQQQNELQRQRARETAGQCCEFCGKINHKTLAWKERRQYRVAAGQSNRARRLHMQYPRNEARQLTRQVAKRRAVVSRVERKWRRRSIATCKLSHS